MIDELRIRALGVIEDATLDLGPGLTVLSGETGAGKTMVLTGLALLMGGRADAALVRAPAARAVVEGRWLVDPAGPVAARVLDAGGSLDDDVLVLTRSLPVEGRSRATAGGTTVPGALLAELADDLVAVQGQSDQQRLLRPSRQRAALDRYAGEPVGEPLAAFQQAFGRWREVRRQLDELRAHARDRAREADLLRAGLAEVEAAAPMPREDDALAVEAERLSHAEQLREAAATAHVALAGDVDGSPALLTDVLAQLAQARRALDGVRGHDPELAGLADRVGEAAVAVSDVSSELASYAARAETDPARLDAVQSRRAVLVGLTRKYGDTLDDVLAWAKDASTRLLDLDTSDEQEAALGAEADALQRQAAALAAEVSAARGAAADRFAAAVTAELAALAMPHARVEVAVSQRLDDDGLQLDDGRRVAVGPWGVDDVELLLVGHPGAPPLPLQRSASGGELSRVMLAVEVVFAGADPVPTFVFDEVDAGVGGRAAVEVGRRLARLARDAQVVVVTHLPQVAAFADRHLLVERSENGSVTRSGVALLAGDDRRRELARMLAGLADSDLGQAHAEELLAAADRAKAEDRALGD